MSLSECLCCSVIGQSNDCDYKITKKISPQPHIPICYSAYRPVQCI